MDRFIIRTEEGGEIIVEGLASDITERKRAEEALQESEEKYRDLVDNAPVGVFRTTIAGDILFLNDAIVRLLGYDNPDELKEKGAVYMYANPDDRRTMIDIVEIDRNDPIPGPDEHVDYYLPEYRPMITKAMRALIEEDRPLAFEARLRTARGNIKWCRALGRAVREGGICTRVYGTFQDITDWKRVEMQMREYADRQAVLLREVNHRVKNNLAVISGILRPYSPDIRLDITASEVLIDSDQAHHLSMVIGELATNSLKYALRQPSKTRIDVGIEEDAGKVCVTFRDNGPGYPGKISFLTKPPPAEGHRKGRHHSPGTSRGPDGGAPS